MIRKKNNKRFTERKWTERQYHVKDNDDVAHKYVIMYCNTNQFPALQFCVPHAKPHGARVLSKNYHLRLNPRLGNVIGEIRRILCACVACTSMLDKPWISGIPPDEQERYKPVTKCNYWLVLEPFNNCNIILLSHKSSPYGAFDDIHQFFLM